MATPNDEPSETSPLLGPQSNGSAFKSLNSSTAGTATPSDSALDETPRGRHDFVDESRAAQFEGQPEIQKQLKYIVPAISIGVFLAAADQTIVATSYSKVGSDLKALNLTSWLATAYFLTLTSFQPLYGKLSDIFGRKPCLLFSYAVFGLGGLFCGLAKDINQLIAARVFQGIGGGGMTTVVSILLSDIIPLKERGVWQGVINIIFASGSSTGAVLGGVLADTVGWRWAFLGQAPLCLLAYIAVYFGLQLRAAENKDWKSKLRRIDFLGAIILVGAVFCMIFGFDRGSNIAWSVPVSYGPLIASLFAFALFLLVEMEFAAEPFVPGHIVFESSLFAGYMCNFFSFGGWLAMLYFFPFFFQSAAGLDAADASLRLLPSLLSGVSGSLFGGVMMKKTGRYYLLTVICYTTLVIGGVIIVLFSGLIIQDTWGMVIGTIVCAFSNGIGVTTSLIALISNAAPEDQAVTTACSYLFRQLGSVIGISLCATAIQQILRADLRQKLGSGKEADDIVQSVRKSLDAIKKLDPNTAHIVRGSYASATRHGFILMTGITFFAMVAAFFIREKKLSR